MSRRYEKDLPVRLAQAEIAEKSREMANKAIRAAHVESKIEEVRSTAKDEIKLLRESLVELRGSVKELAHAVRKGETVRPVLVEARVASDNSKVEIVRLDSGEVVEERALSEDDRQMELDDVLARIESDTKTADAKSRAAGERDDDDEDEVEAEVAATEVADPAEDTEDISGEPLDAEDDGLAEGEDDEAA